MKKVSSFNNLFAVIFLVIAAGLIVYCLILLSKSTLGDMPAAAIGGVITFCTTTVTMVVQYYFRKRPSEKEPEQ